MFFSCFFFHFSLFFSIFFFHFFSFFFISFSCFFFFFFIFSLYLFFIFFFYFLLILIFFSFFYYFFYVFFSYIFLLSFSLFYFIYFNVFFLVFFLFFFHFFVSFFFFLLFFGIRRKKPVFLRTLNQGSAGSFLRTCRTKVWPCPFSKPARVWSLEIVTGLSPNCEPAEPGLAQFLLRTPKLPGFGVPRAGSELGERNWPYITYRTRVIPVLSPNSKPGLYPFFL